MILRSEVGFAYFKNKLGERAEEFTKSLEVPVFEHLSNAVFAEFHRSHGLVERVCELEERLPSVRAKTIQDAEVRAFATDRMQAAIRFTASLSRTAREKSADLRLPSWLKR